VICSVSYSGERASNWGPELLIWSSGLSPASCWLMGWAHLSMITIRPQFFFLSFFVPLLCVTQFRTRIACRTLGVVVVACIILDTDMDVTTLWNYGHRFYACQCQMFESVQKKHAEDTWCAGGGRSPVLDLSEAFLVWPRGNRLSTLSSDDSALKSFRALVPSLFFCNVVPHR
jgi:hypothetical protein